MDKKREGFSSKFGAIAAAAGAAVGLGNIWGFPYVAGKNGGGAFVIIYLVAVLMIGIPLMVSEFVIGKKGGKNMIGSLNKIAPDSGWKYAGWLGVVTCFLILGFYGVVAGWSMAHFFKALVGAFNGLEAKAIGDGFGGFINGYWPVFWHFVFMFSTAFIVVAGIRKGIERFSKIIMPALFVILTILAVFGLFLHGSSAGLSFLFLPDFTVITWKTAAIAIGSAFFSLGVGNGVMVTLGSYLNEDAAIGKTAFQVSVTDTLVAVVAGIAIFPAVFALGFEPAKSAGLAFITVPAVLQHFPGGVMIHYLFTLMFFFLLSVAALSSSVATLEVVVAYFTEEANADRKKAAYVISGIMFLIGIPCALSVGAVPSIKIMGEPLVWFLVDFIEAFLLPAGGIMFAIFVGWVIKRQDFESIMAVDGEISWYVSPMFTLIKYVIPVVVFIILIYTANEYFFHM